MIRTGLLACSPIRICCANLSGGRKITKDHRATGAVLRRAKADKNMAESSVFYYETEVEWKNEKEGQIGAPSLPAVTVGAAPEFKGREGVWSSEHLFVASLNIYRDGRYHIFMERCSGHFVRRSFPITAQTPQSLQL